MIENASSSLTVSKFSVPQEDEVEVAKFRKTKNKHFSKNEHFFLADTHTCVCVLGRKKYLLFGKFGMFCFLVTSFLRFAQLFEDNITIKIAWDYNTNRNNI